jgi:hypothetical protein
MRCWAYGPQGQRCDQETEVHNRDEVGAIHSFTMTWADDECIEPGQVAPAAPQPTKFEMLVPDDENDNDFATGRCFVCNCTHPEGPEVPCDEHGCSTFVP